MWLGEGVLVILPDRQMNSLAERGLVGNFVLGNFLAYCQKFSKDKYSQKYHNTSPLNKTFTCPQHNRKILTPPQNFGSFKWDEISSTGLGG